MHGSRLFSTSDPILLSVSTSIAVHQAPLDPRFALELHASPAVFPRSLMFVAYRVSSPFCCCLLDILKSVRFTMPCITGYECNSLGS